MTLPRGYRANNPFNDDAIHINTITINDIIQGFTGPPPIAVFDVENGKTIKIDRISTTNGSSYDIAHTPKMKDITETGVYLVLASGSFYSYFDGEKWCGDGEKYEFKY